MQGQSPATPAETVAYHRLMEVKKPPAKRARGPRYVAAPKRGAAGQVGRWRIEVVGRDGMRLDVRTLRAGDAIAALLAGQEVEPLPEDAFRPRFEVLPRDGRWLVVRLDRSLHATEVARTGDEPLALRVASLLADAQPALDPPPRRTIMRLGLRQPRRDV